MVRYLKEHQRDFMPEDTKAGMIQAYLDRYTGSMVCSKQLFREALNHPFDEPKQWEIREVNDIMNHCVTGWHYFSNPRMFRNTAGRRAGNVKPRQRIPATEPKKSRRICGGHRADGASFLKIPPRCRLYCTPVAGVVAGKNPITAGFFPISNQSNRKIKKI